ncbi:MAG: hypothetical protein QNJ12_12965 [Ilumatobacter sp.]|uniref:hypothetical protein n=1 Tax=Ilumatobacter sp. TaxID=1967498 RepID=UPI0026084614|nr:hypothetical protein [Ilumatobacter sp.]MDJ0769706.1 hypothetical protein [Ilumatobacter sp.]
MTRLVAVVVGAVVAASALAACGTTYVDSSVTTPPAASAGSTTLPPVATDAPVAELLDEIETLMFDLDERIIEQDGHVSTLARIEDLWFAAELQIRSEDPDDVFNFEQAIELAQTGVTRLRPADASKGYKILNDVIDAYLER